MEHELIRWLIGRTSRHPQVPMGIGDDAALLQFTQGAQTVATTDMLMDGVDFVLGSDAPHRIGRKALAVNLSDLAAMAAKPVAALVSLAIPRSGVAGGGSLALAQQLYEGILPLAEEFGVALAGGDTNVWEGPLVLSITALGEVAPGKAFLRSGGKPGDELLVTGSLGGSRLAKQFDFTPRIREALQLGQIAAVHAAQDVSDGLLLDLSRLAAASGCGAELQLAQIPVFARRRGVVIYLEFRQIAARTCVQRRRKILNCCSPCLPPTPSASSASNRSPHRSLASVA
jgi:thiamine-monophosphate kinase